MVWWAYVDESIRGSAKSRLGMGGAISRLEDWEALSVEWEAVLRSYGLTMFHMVDGSTVGRIRRCTHGMSQL